MDKVTKFMQSALYLDELIWFDGCCGNNEVLMSSTELFKHDPWSGDGRRSPGKLRFHQEHNVATLPEKKR